MVEIGAHAPQFSLYDTDKKIRSLNEFAGKKTVLAFFPGAFTGVCTKEMCTFRDSLTELNSLNADVVAISVDSFFANKAFKDQNGLTFPVLSDIKHETIKVYGVELSNFAGVEGYNTSQRAVFIIDTNGKVSYKWVAENPGIEPNYAEVKEALKKI